MTRRRPKPGRKRAKPGPKPLGEHKRSVRLQISVTVAVAERITAVAAAAGMSPLTWGAAALERAVGEAHTVIATAQTETIRVAPDPVRGV